MKIFGLEINWNWRASPDQVVVRAVKPDTIPVAQIPTVKIGSLSYAQQFSQGRGHFQSAEYDLSEIGKIEDTDAFVRQSFKKKEGLMFKEGFGLKGADKRTIRYYKARMAQIAQASNTPTVLLLKRTARSLIRTSNAFLIKVRLPKASGGRIRVNADGKRLKPIAAYFPAAPETMRADINAKTGRVDQWRQLLPNGQWQDYKPEDVVHFVIDKREGFLFGVPTIIPVIDDIRALRQIEENIELLLYQCLFPLFHYKVGTEMAPAGYTEEGDKEVDAVEEQIRIMPSEGAIVTPERHEITAIGSEGRALRAEGYLTHFKKRVFAGLGVSSVDMGDGDTTNRATAQTLSRAIIDSVKAIQDDLEAQWDQLVVSELLLESTLGDEVLEEESMVHLRFAEIDIQNKIELEKHAIEVFEANGTTYDEFRSEMAREPIPIPEDPEDQDPAKYPEWMQTHWKLFKEPENLIRAVDEPYSMAAQAATEMRSLALTMKQQKTADQEGQKAEQRAAQADRDTQVAVAKARPVAKSTKDHYLATAFNDLESETADRIRTSIYNRGIIDNEYILSLARVWASDTVDKLHTIAVAELIRGFNDQTNMLAADAEVLISTGRNVLYSRLSFRINKLVENTVNLVSRRVDENLGDVKLAEAQADVSREMHIAFDATRYRTDFIWDVEIRKAYAFGRVLGMRHLGEYGFELDAHANSCERCQAANGRIVLATNADIEDVPPLHPNSRMKFKVIRNDPNAIDVADALVSVPQRKKGSAAVTQTDPSIAKLTAVCPDCGNTATWQLKAGNFHCKKCNATFDDQVEQCITGEG